MHDLRQAFYGMAIATVAGLAIGGVSKPDIREMTDLDGPQLLSGTSGERLAPGIRQNASWTSYGGQVPDYVIGTDWIQPAYPVEMAPAHPEPGADPEPARMVNEAPPVRLAPVKYVSEAAAAPWYPSMGGDILAGVQAAAASPTPESAPDEAASPPA